MPRPVSPTSDPNIPASSSHNAATATQFSASTANYLSAPLPPASTLEALKRSASPSFSIPLDVAIPKSAAPGSAPIPSFRSHIPQQLQREGAPPTSIDLTPLGQGSYFPPPSSTSQAPAAPSSDAAAAHSLYSLANQPRSTAAPQTRPASNSFQPFNPNFNDVSNRFFPLETSYASSSSGMFSPQLPIRSDNGRPVSEQPITAADKANGVRESYNHQKKQ